MSVQGDRGGFHELELTGFLVLLVHARTLGFVSLGHVLWS
jgi:hypothetical protein